MTTHHEGHDPCASFPSVRHLRTTYPIATKEHLCLICGAPIPTGTTHIKNVFVDKSAKDSGFRSSRYHLRCPVTA